MKPEDRLRGVAEAFTRSIEPASDAWTRIRARLDAKPGRRGTPRRRALAGFATVVAVALVVTLVVAVRDGGDGNGRTDVVANAGTSEPPGEIVAVTGDGRVVVLDTATGDEIRTLTDRADRSTAVTVTPDGERVFFDLPVGVGSDRSREIATVPTQGGDVETIVDDAARPAVSPNGDLLAFTGVGEPTLRVVELPDRFDDWDPEVVGQGVTGEGPLGWVHLGIGALTWAPDSRHLLYLLNFAPRSSYRVVEVAPRIQLDETPVLPIVLRSPCRGYTYLGNTGLLVTADALPTGGPNDGSGTGTVTAVDPATGEERRELFQVPLPFDWIDCAAAPVADVTGAHVLAILPARTTYRLALYRGSEGAGEPVRVADDVTAAAWVEDADRDERREPAPPVAERATRTLLCGDDVPFTASSLPDGFSPDAVPGAGNPSAVAHDPQSPAIHHYTDGDGRVIEVHHPGTAIVTGDPPPAPNVTVLGRPGVLAYYALDAVIGPPVEPAEPLVVEFDLAGGVPGPFAEPCDLWSLDGYGVTDAELRAVAEGLVPLRG